MSETNSSAFHIRCFGPFAVEVNEQPAPRLHSKKEKLLLAYLAIRYGREVERAEVAAALWPESQDEQARFNLRQTLSSLRKALGDAADHLEAPEKNTLRLRLSPPEADIAQFETATRRMDNASLEILATMPLRPLLEGWGEKEGEEWIEPERQARRKQSVKAMQELFRRALTERDYAGAKRRLQQMTVCGQMDEALWRELIQELLAVKEYPLALRVFEELEAELKSTGRALPSPETMRLHHSIPEAERKRRLWEPLPASPLHLPVPLDRFVGREAEREALWRLIVEENARLITLTGPGGAGKTRLALEAARQLAERFANQVWFVPLSDARDTRDIADALLKAMGKKRAAAMEPFEQAVNYLNGKKSPCLLIFDNFEQLASAGASSVGALLAAVPRLTCLVTSRRRLGISGEHPFAVDALPTPDKGQPLHTLIDNPSVQLFVDRVRKPRPAFQLTEANAQAVADICRRLEGLPLSLELAASRASMMTPAQMLLELDRRFALLTRQETAPKPALKSSAQKSSAFEPPPEPRQQSLQATLQWSYDLLPPELQVLLSRLSAFRGGWTLEAAQTVCQRPSALDGLDRLHACSLLMLEENSFEMRWRMLETVREFAREQRDATEQAQRQRRHARYFLALARNAQRALWGQEQEQWLARLEREQENLRAALLWAREHDMNMALRFATSLARYWEVRGCLREDYEYLSEALARTDLPHRKALRMDALATMANLAWHRGDEADIRPFAEERMRLAREVGSSKDVARALNGMGLQAMNQGRNDEAQAYFEEGLTLERQRNDLHSVSNLLGNLGCLFNSKGDNAAAMRRYQESLALRETLGDEYSLAQTLSGVGLTAHRLGDYALAQVSEERSLAISRRLGNRRGAANSLHHLGLIYEAQGRRSEAEALYAEGLRLRAAVEDQLGIAESLDKYASRAVERGNLIGAVRLLGASEAFRQSTGLAVAYYDRSEYEEITRTLAAKLSKADFRHAWKAGSLLTLEEATLEALDIRQEGIRH